MEEEVKREVMPPPPYERKKKKEEKQAETEQPNDSIFVNKSSAFMQDMMSKEE